MRASQAFLLMRFADVRLPSMATGTMTTYQPTCVMCMPNLKRVCVALVFLASTPCLAQPMVEWHPLQHRAGKSVAVKTDLPLPLHRPVEMKLNAELHRSGEVSVRCDDAAGPDFSRLKQGDVADDTSERARK